MAKQTAAQKKAIEAGKAAARAAVDAADKLEINPSDAHNILVLLQRVQTTGVDEATLLAILASKLKAIKGAYTGEPSGENANPTS